MPYFVFHCQLNIWLHTIWLQTLLLQSIVVAEQTAATVLEAPKAAANVVAALVA